VIPLGLTDHLALLGLSVSCGSIQPINPELAIDVTYPSDETAVESVQQVGGNLLGNSSYGADYEFFYQTQPLDSDIRRDVLLLFAVTAVTIDYFSFFDAPLRRTLADSEE
jgi:FLVCR family feline leukemia virus subgroup C receptor-related protein